MFDFIISISMKTGIIVVPLFLSGLLGWFLLMKLYFFIKKQEKPSKVVKWEKIVISLDTGDFDKINKTLEEHPDSIYAQFLKIILNNRHAPERHLEHLHQGFLLKHIDGFSRNLLSVKVLAAVAPLLGLLGTVNGMIRTFEIISLYGNSNPVLMADGISEALLTTQSGLIVAFPLLFAHVIFNNRLKRLKNSMSDVVTEILHHKKST